MAFKEILGNMFAGIMILYTKEFTMGDVIEVQADQTYFGRIEEITIRYTIIRTLDLRQVVIPNLKMISVPIKTFSSEEIVKLSTSVGIHYNTDVEKAIQVVVQAINNLNFVQQKENTTVFVSDFGDSAIELKCIFFFDPKS
ncbi:MAG: mechanosensitive ion channel [bacterium]|nr:mechanosensitive ion channel [bacterium]